MRRLGWLILLAVLFTGTGSARAAHEHLSHRDHCPPASSKGGMPGRNHPLHPGHAHCQVHLRLDQPVGTDIATGVALSPAPTAIASPEPRPATITRPIRRVHCCRGPPGLLPAS